MGSFSHCSHKQGVGCPKLKKKAGTIQDSVEPYNAELGLSIFGAKKVSTYLFIQQKLSECPTKAGNQECFVTLSHSHTLSFSHSITLHMLNNFCFHVQAQKLLSHFHSLTHSLSLSLDMLNNFCLHVYVQKSLFIAENCNAFFDSHSHSTLSCYFRSHRAGSQLKRF